ncbi:MAG: YceH family protein [Verrucomicrobiales bacterium]|nr:YceH family protein [Verrucomicrobiales bacterium]
MSEDEEPDTGIPRLSFEETRVLGCLLEKEMTTPDNYPLTLNALHSACNQSSNRDPVTDLGTDEVESALEDLRYKKLALLVHQAGARVPKAKHTIENEFPYLEKAELALVTVLFLRGQQTLGELRQRTERMHPFADLDRAQASLNKLIEYQPAPLVKEIPAGGGRRVVTFVHLFSGGAENLPVSSETPVPEAASAEVTSDEPTWREKMEGEIAELREEIETLKRQLGV